MTDENHSEPEKSEKEKSKPREPEKDRMMRLNEVIGRVGVSRPTIYRFVKKGLFPEPMQLPGRNIRWRESEIDAWLSRLAIRPAGLRPIKRPLVQRRPTKEELDRAKPVRQTPKPFYPEDDDGLSPLAS